MVEMLRIGKLAGLSVLLVIILGGKSVLAGNWWESIKIKGNLRYRHELIDKDGKDQRNRQRIRARIGIHADVSAYTKIGLQLASGSDDPVSTNQTMGNTGSTKPIGLDLAYFHANHKQLPGFQLTAGKMKNPFFKPGKSELIWDGDWNPEGAVLSYSKKSQQAGVKLSGGGFWIEERSSGKNSYLAAFQGLFKLTPDNKKTGITIGGSIFNFVNSKGFQPFFDKDDSFGNAVINVPIGGDSVAVYANDYELIELFGEVTHNFESIPVTIIGDFVTNTAVDSLGTGWTVGMRVGKAKKPGSWQFRYLYKQVKQDAVLGVLTDSDFLGGGTDGEGHEIGGAIQLANNTSFQFTYFINKLGIDAASQVDFNRLQADLQLKF